jgi:formylglycine-generating enzyme required for sulfatase activity
MTSRHNTLAQLLAAAAQGDASCLTSCLARPARGAAPPWLDVCLFAAESADEQARRQLIAAVAQASPAPGFVERQRDLADRAACHIMLARRPGGQVAPTAIPPLPPRSPADERIVALRGRWVQQAAERAEPHGLHSDWAWRESAPAGASAACRMLALLVAGGEHGVLAELRLWRLPERGGGLRFVPIPASALCPLTPSFHKSLAQVTAWLQRQLRPSGGDARTAAADPTDHVLAWDLAPINTGLASLDGASAGAAFALGAAWLLREFAPPALREPLVRISPAVLGTIGVTAAVAPDGALAPVGGLQAKTASLRLFGQVLERPVPVYVAAAQPLHMPALGEAPPPISKPADMQALAREVADRSASLSPAQQLLHDWLLAGDPSAKPSLHTLRDVIASDRTDARHHALARWAHWGREQGGSLHQRFVPLALAPQLAGSAGAAARQSWGGIDKFLSEAEPKMVGVRSDDDPPELRPRSAYLLCGAPGSGKTTLLRHLEQRLCIDMLRALARGDESAEVPLYLALSGVPAASEAARDDPALAEAEIQNWLRAEAETQFGRDSPLNELLAGSAAVRPRSSMRLRLLLDGLNELKVPPGADREERARAVVGACLRLLGEGGLPPLLSTRAHHPFELHDRHLLEVLTLDVLPWGKEQIEPYLKLRFRDQPGAADRHWSELSAPGNAAALELCRVPMNLDGQCELLEHSKGGKLFTERASLFTAWLWQRLWRETQVDGILPVNSLMHEDWLLSALDRKAIKNRTAWLGHALRKLPCQGLLLPTLMRQAGEQWRQAARDNPQGMARGEVKVDVSTVAHWLPEEQRELWLQAVQDLGLARVEDGQFGFSHQSWGEFLASLRLLPADTPEAASESDVQKLLREIAPPPFARRDVQEIEHLREQVAQAWGRVPQALWDRLLEEGVTIPLRKLHLWLDPHWERRGGLSDAARGDVAWLSYWAGFKEHPTADDSEPQCSVSLREWGRHQPRVNRFGADWWRHPAAWSELVGGLLWAPFRDVVLAELERLLGERDAQQLLSLGSLAALAAGDLDEPMLLALQALPRPQPWLERLCAEGHLRMAAEAVLTMQRQLEPDPWARPLPLLQYLRWRLLLRSVDAGASVRERVLASGLLEAMRAASPPAGDPLHAAWQHAIDDAFKGEGFDVRLRIEAGLLLGELGDTLRYERVPGHPGLRLREPHWIGTGADVRVAMASGGVSRTQQFRIGGDRRGIDHEKPAINPKLPGFAIAAYPVTVAEWMAFVEAGGYESEESAWWTGQGPAAQAWLRQRQADARAAGEEFQPWALKASRFNNPSQPITGITWWEAMAYALWAKPLHERPGNPWTQCVPTEVQWEAGVRGPRTPQNKALSWPHPEGDAVPDALCFNHSETRWGRTTPVGVFSRGYSRAGVADGAGNTWEWCANQYVRKYRGERGIHAGGPQPDPADGDAPRAARGGDSYAADYARAGYRDLRHPGYVYHDTGLRLVRVRLPH